MKPPARLTKKIRVKTQITNTGNDKSSQAHAYNPNYSGGRDPEVRSQPGQIVCETLS
jgi:hypothetical protein